MSTHTSPITGIYAADPVHSSAGFAVKYMGVSTFRATLDSLSAKLEGGPNGVVLVGVESIFDSHPGAVPRARAWR